MAFNVRSVTKALKAEGIDAELVRGNGYFYFWGDEPSGWYSSSVAVFELDAFTIEEWVAEYKRLRAEDQKRLGLI